MEEDGSLATWRKTNLPVPFEHDPRKKGDIGEPQPEDQQRNSRIQDCIAAASH